MSDNSMVLICGYQFWLNNIWKFKEDKISLPSWESDSVGMSWVQESEFSTIFSSVILMLKNYWMLENTDIGNRVNFEQAALKTQLEVTVSDLKKNRC